MWNFTAEGVCDMLLTSGVEFLVTGNYAADDFDSGNDTGAELPAHTSRNCFHNTKIFCVSL